MDQQRIEIDSMGIRVNGREIPGFILADSVTVAPCDKGSSRVTLSLYADTVDIDTSAPPIDASSFMRCRCGSAIPCQHCSEQ
ncbi:hypothetical protein ACFWQG_13115 [Rhodococcus sp. NPDC058532]|uniref:hypothetical protein n=1 Tax=Rhodococcus sp. NPDC058532 TaxID=3346540 RepID=UPI00364C70EA